MEKDTKRFAEPPRDLNKLIKLFVLKFGLLKELVNQLAEDKEKQDDQSFRHLQGRLKLELSYQPFKGGPHIPIEDSSDLSRAFE